MHAHTVAVRGYQISFEAQTSGQKLIVMPGRKSIAHEMNKTFNLNDKTMDFSDG